MQLYPLLLKAPGGPPVSIRLSPNPVSMAALLGSDEHQELLFDLETGRTATLLFASKDNYEVNRPNLVFDDGLATIQAYGNIAAFMTDSSGAMTDMTKNEMRELAELLNGSPEEG